MHLRHAISATFLALLMIAAVPLLGSQKVYACSCIAPAKPKDALDQSAAVFRGVAKRIEANAISKTVTFEATEVWKGEVGAIFTIGTAADSAGCGVDFVLNEEYLVYASGDANELSVNLCSRTTAIATASEDLRALGEGRTIQTIGGSSSASSSQSPAPQPSDVKDFDSLDNVVVYSALGISVLNAVATIAIAVYLVMNKKR